MADYVFVKSVTNQYALVYTLRTTYSNNPVLGNVSGLSYDPTSTLLTLTYSPALTVTDCNVLITAVNGFTNPSEEQVINMIVTSQAQQNASTDFTASNFSAFTGSFTTMSATVASILDATFCNITVLNSISTANDLVVADEVRGGRGLFNSLSASNVVVQSISGLNAAFSNINIPSISTNSANFASLQSFDATFCNVTVLNSIITANDVVDADEVRSAVSTVTGVLTVNNIVSSNITNSRSIVSTSGFVSGFVADTLTINNALTGPLITANTITTSGTLVTPWAGIQVLNANTANNSNLTVSGTGAISTLRAATLAASNLSVTVGLTGASAVFNNVSTPVATLGAITTSGTLITPWAGIQTLNANNAGASNLTVSGTGAFTNLNVLNLAASNLNTPSGVFTSSVTASSGAFSNLLAPAATLGAITTSGSIVGPLARVQILNANTATASNLTVSGVSSFTSGTFSNILAPVATLGAITTSGTLIAPWAGIQNLNANSANASNLTVLGTSALTTLNTFTVGASNLNVVSSIVNTERVQTFLANSASASNLTVTSINTLSLSASNITVPISITASSGTFSNLLAPMATLGAVTTSGSLIAPWAAFQGLNANIANASNITVSGAGAFTNLNALNLAASNLSLTVSLNAPAGVFTGGVTASSGAFSNLLAPVATLGAVTTSGSLIAPFASVQVLNVNNANASNLIVSGAGNFANLNVFSLNASNITVPQSIISTSGTFTNLTAQNATFCNITVLNNISTANDIVVADEVRALNLVGQSASASNLTIANNTILDKLSANWGGVQTLNANIVGLSNVSIGTGTVNALTASNLSVAIVADIQGLTVNQYTGSNAVIHTVTFSNVTIGSVAVAAGSGSNQGFLTSTNATVGTVPLGLFGSSYFIARSTTLNADTSTAYTSKLALTTGVVPTGIYRVALHFAAYNNSGVNNRMMRVLSFINTSGSVWHDHIYTMNINNGFVSSETHSAFETYTVASPAVQTVNVGWFSLQGSLIGMGPTRLELYRIG